MTIIPLTLTLSRKGRGDAGGIPWLTAGSIHLPAEENMGKKWMCLVQILFIILIAHTSRGATMDKERTRETLVVQELGKYEHRVLTYDATALSEMEKSFLRHMLAAAKIIEEINMLQINFKNLEFREQIGGEGSPADQELFHRNQCPWCLEINDSSCNALKSLPEKSIGWNFWPQAMNEKLLEAFEKMPDGKSLLSPFTYVEKKNDKYIAIPFAAHSLIADRMKKLAQELRAAIAFTNEPSLKKFLRSRAKAFETKSDFPYDDSDYDWIALEGPWDVTVGPYETYKEPMKQKAQFAMYIAREDRNVGKELSVFKDHLQEFEHHFAEFIGEDLYKSRKLDPRIEIRAVELIFAAGDARSPHGATVAYHLPNRGKAVEESLYKKVLLINHMKLFTPLMQKRAHVALAQNQVSQVDEWADIMNTTMHELAHGFGAHEELAINVDGQKTTVGKALGSWETLMEELKADVASLWFIPYLIKQKLMKPEEAEKRYATATMHLFGLLQYSLNGTYPQMAAIETGNLMEQKALTFDAKNRRFTIHCDRIADAVSSLLKKIVTIQLTGDRLAAETLRDRYVKKISDEVFEFQPLLKDPMASLKQIFDQEKLKSYAIDYAVTGL